MAFSAELFSHSLFVCVLSRIHLFMSPLSSPLFPSAFLLDFILSLSPFSLPFFDLAAVVCRSARRHAGFPGSQAARRQPATSGQPGCTLPAHQLTPTQRQGALLLANDQDQGKTEDLRTLWAAERPTDLACT